MISVHGFFGFLDQPTPALLGGGLFQDHMSAFGGHACGSQFHSRFQTPTPPKICHKMGCCTVSKSIHFINKRILTDNVAREPQKYGIRTSSFITNEPILADGGGLQFIDTPAP